MIHELEKNLSQPFQLMMDIEGPSIRTGEIISPRQYLKGEKFRMLINEISAQGSDIVCDYPGIINDVKVGDIVRIESGLFDTIVRKK